MFAKVKERIEAGTRPGAALSSSGGGSNGGAEKKTMPSIISRDMVVNGNLDTPGEVHVEGTIRGDVRCARLIIGASGSVEGHVFANIVRIHGSVRGEINAEEVFLLNGSSVSGDVVQNMLEIAPGAIFEGAVRRRGAVATPRMLAAPEAPAADSETLNTAEAGDDTPPEPVEPTGPVPAAETPAAVPGDATPAAESPVSGDSSTPEPGKTEA
jgi:cytoskeletal protein CcmA (bactofilin family)